MASFAVVLLTASLLVVTSSAAPKKPKFSITVPEECKGKGFCAIRPRGYDEIEKMFDEILPPHLINVGSRSGPPPISQPIDDDDNCPSDRKEQTVYTHREIADPRNTKVDIIVQTKLLPQSLVEVTCLNSDKQNRNLMENRPQCFTKLGLDNFNIELTCKESTATRSLLVYDPDEDALKMKNYTIAVCCSCHIKDL